jgi:hypothetical protein
MITEGDYEPNVQCTKCRRTRSIRWYQQSTTDFINVPHPKTGQDRWYGEPVPVCPLCQPDMRRGSRAGKSGNLYLRPPSMA